MALHLMAVDSENNPSYLEVQQNRNPLTKTQWDTGNTPSIAFTKVYLYNVRLWLSPIPPNLVTSQVLGKNSAKLIWQP